MLAPESRDKSKSETAPKIEYFPPAQPWRVVGNEVHLLGMRCEHCGAKAFPAREVCSGCGQDSGIRQTELSARGRIYTFSEVHVAPKGFPVPYVLAYVDLDDGVRLLGQVDGTAQDLALDQEVAVVLGEIRKRGDGTSVVSYKFRRVAS